MKPALGRVYHVAPWVAYTKAVVRCIEFGTWLLIFLGAVAIIGRIS